MTTRKTKSATRSLSEQEMVDILEDIARNGRNAAAKIAAIKTLREMRRSVDERKPVEGFETLDELAPRRRKNSA